MRNDAARALDAPAAQAGFGGDTGEAAEKRRKQKSEERRETCRERTAFHESETGPVRRQMYTARREYDPRATRKQVASLAGDWRAEAGHSMASTRRADHVAHTPAAPVSVRSSGFLARAGGMVCEGAGSLLRVGRLGARTPAHARVAGISGRETGQAGWHKGLEARRQSEVPQQVLSSADFAIRHSQGVAHHGAAERVHVRAGRKRWLLSSTPEESEEHFMTFSVVIAGEIQYITCVGLPMGWQHSAYYFVHLMRVVVRHLRAPELAEELRKVRELRKSGALPRILQRQLKAPQDQHRLRILAYVDDFLFLAPTREEALQAMRQVDDLFLRLGVQKHPTKFTPEPVQQLVHLGMDVDLESGRFRVTKKRCAQLRAQAKDLICRATRHQRWVPAKELASFAGLANACLLAVEPARFFLRSIYVALETRSSWEGNLERRCNLEASDASDPSLRSAGGKQHGWGGALNGKHTARGAWTPAQAEQHITLLELKAVRFTIETSCARCANWWLLDANGIQQDVEYIRSEANVLADALSRERVHPLLRPLRRSFISYVEDKWQRRHTVDRFATFAGAVAPRYYTIRHCEPQAEGVGAFTTTWRREVNFARPPPNQISAVIRLSAGSGGVGHGRRAVLAGGDVVRAAYGADDGIHGSAMDGNRAGYVRFQRDQALERHRLPGRARPAWLHLSAPARAREVVSQVRATANWRAVAVRRMRTALGTSKAGLATRVLAGGQYRGHPGALRCTLGSVCRFLRSRGAERAASHAGDGGHVSCSRIPACAGGPRALSTFAWRGPRGIAVLRAGGERARQPNRQLARVLQQLQVTAPRGTYYSWHSLRKGAATCAFALHVRYESICAYGGWSVASGVAHDYIDPLAASDARGAHFFGWLMPSVVPPGAPR
ncbi:reverse transcriptase domain-containing protein [Pycnococcus provasolii]